MGEGVRSRGLGPGRVLETGRGVCAVTGAGPSCWAQSRAGPEAWGQLPKWGEVLRWEQSVRPATLRPAARVPGGHLCAR